MIDVRYMPAAEKYIKKITDHNLKTKIKEAIEKIAQNPRIGECKKQDLAGIFSYDVFYNKTNYEIAYKYQNDTVEIILILLVGTRENFYKELKKYI